MGKVGDLPSRWQRNLVGKVLAGTTVSQYGGQIGILLGSCSRDQFRMYALPERRVLWVGRRREIES
jgi:predicted component of type VI protein secretion system